MTDFMAAVNGFSEAWTPAMFRACWQGAIAIAVVWVICRAFPRIPARVRCWLWRLAYLKLLLVLLWATPIELPVLPASSAPIAAKALELIATPEAKAAVEAYRE